MYPQSIINIFNKDRPSVINNRIDFESPKNTNTSYLSPKIYMPIKKILINVAGIVLIFLLCLLFYNTCKYNQLENEENQFVIPSFIKPYNYFQ